MGKYWRHALTCFYLLSIINKASAQQTLIFDKMVEYKINGGFTYFLDTSQALQIKDIYHLYESNKFKLISNNSFQQGYHVYWLHFNLKNSTGFDNYWVVDFQNWSYVEAYIKGDSIVHKTGHLHPYNLRNYRVANKSYILLPLKDDEVKEVFVRIESKYNNDLVPTSLDFKTIPKALVDQENEQNGKFFYSFLAIFSTMFLYNSFVLISTKLKSYAYYLVVLLLTFYTTAYNSGYLIELFGSINAFPILITYFEKVSSILLGISFLLFTTEFLAIKDRYPSWNKISKIILLSYIITGIIWLIHEELGMTLSLLPGLATILALNTFTIKSIKDGYPGAIYFFIGCCAFLVGVLLIVLSFYKIIPLNIWTFSYSLSIGSTILIVFLSFALANMINALRSENERMKQERFIAKIEIQEQILQDISNDIHDNISPVLGFIDIRIHQIEKLFPESAKNLFYEIKSLLAKVNEDLRDLSKMLNPDYIGQIGLVNAIKQQLRLLESTEIFSTNFTLKSEVIKYDSQSELMLFRVIQELLHNIVKHAKATTIEIIVNYQSKKLLITIQDNGKGFNGEIRNDPNNQGQGLRNIYRRMSLIKGSIKFEGSLNKGTLVTIVIPE